MITNLKLQLITQWPALITQLFTLLFGAFVFLTNVMLVAAIMYHDILRAKKEYIMVGALALADCVHGYGYVYGNTYRFVIYFQQVRQLASRQA